MRGSELLSRMELISPEYIESAEAFPKKKKSRSAYIAAAFACALLAGILTMNMFWGHNDVIDELPKITIPEYNYGGMGYESYSCYDISELTNGNPWNEDINITSLPVYKNNSFDDTLAGVPKGLSENEMKGMLESKVNALHAQVSSTEIITDEKKPENVTEIRATTDIGRITVYADGQITYSLPDDGIDLPEGTNSGDYLISTFDNLLNFNETKIAEFTDNNAYAEPMIKYIAYDSAGDITEDILNYNFRKAVFNMNDDSLHSVKIYDSMSAAEITGYYPIITPRDATDRLISGQYQTSVPYGFPGEKYIGKTELIYRTGPMEETLIPYYRFYVLLGISGENLRTYGAYYVPAITEEYISDMITYDGRFN